MTTMTTRERQLEMYTERYLFHQQQKLRRKYEAEIEKKMIKASQKARKKAKRTMFRKKPTVKGITEMIKFGLIIFLFSLGTGFLVNVVVS